MVLSRSSSGCLTHLGSLSFDDQGAFVIQRRVPQSWIIEPDILEYGPFNLASWFPPVAPVQFGLERFEERYGHGSVVTLLAFATHRKF